MDGKKAIEGYKEWYCEHYNTKPTEKLIETFCRINGIEIERKEVAKVADYKECSVLNDVPLNDVPVVTNETIREINQYTEENYKALETNYHNLFAEFQEVSAIAQEQKNEIQKCAAIIAKLSINIGKLLNIVEYYRELFSPSDIGKLEEIKKEVM
jgi:hypothetical protein